MARTDGAVRPRSGEGTGAGPLAPPPVALLLPGQGAQQQGMALGLYGSEPAFTDAVDEVFRLLRGEGARIRADWLSESPVVALDDVRRAQPLLFAVNYGLSRMLLDWGVRPAALLGHSAGEAVAAVVAGVLSLPDAVALLAERVALVAGAQPGGMLAVAAAPADVEPFLTDDVVVGAVNSPTQVMLAGPDPELARVAETLQVRGFTCVRAKASSGFHSPMLRSVCARQIPAFDSVQLYEARLRVISGYTAGRLTRAQALDPAFWALQPAEPVLFGPALNTLLADGPYLLVEAGPGQSLTTLARRHPAVTRGGSAALPLLPARPRGPEKDREAALKAARRLAELGHVPRHVAERRAAGRTP